MEDTERTLQQYADDNALYTIEPDEVRMLAHSARSFGTSRRAAFLQTWHAARVAAQSRDSREAVAYGEL